MKFSVLMAVYFRENYEYFEKALKSITEQTLMPDEIVIVKDGPLTDSLESVISSFVESYPGLFKIVGLEENRGLGKALRIGILECSNDWIARMDSDDISRSDRFKIQVEFIEKNPDVDIVGSDIIEFVNDIENVLAVRKVPYKDQDIRRFAHLRNPFNHMTVMYRKQAVIEAGNYQESNLNEDYNLWVRMIMNGAHCANIEDFLVCARTGRDMYKRRGGFKYALSDIKLQKYFHEIGFNGFPRMLINMIIRTSVRLTPNFLREKIYMSGLRKK